jgi:hypothetical protein
MAERSADDTLILLPTESATGAKPASGDLGSSKAESHIGLGVLVLESSEHLLTYNLVPNYSEYKATGTGLVSEARVTEDGRIAISLDLKQELPDLPAEYAQDVKEFAIDHKSWREVPRLSIVVMIVGSRGARFASSYLGPHEFICLYLILWQEMYSLT